MYKMEISAEQTQRKRNITNGIKGVINLKRQKMGTVTSFKYLDGLKPEVLSTIYKPLQLLQSKANMER